MAWPQVLEIRKGLANMPREFSWEVSFSHSYYRDYLWSGGAGWCLQPIRSVSIASQVKVKPERMTCWRRLIIAAISSGILAEPPYSFSTSQIGLSFLSPFISAIPGYVCSAFTVAKRWLTRNVALRLEVISRIPLLCFVKQRKIAVLRKQSTSWSYISYPPYSLLLVCSW